MMETPDWGVAEAAPLIADRANWRWAYYEYGSGWCLLFMGTPLCGLEAQRTDSPGDGGIYAEIPMSFSDPTKGMEERDNIWGCRQCLRLAPAFIRESYRERKEGS